MRIEPGFMLFIPFLLLYYKKKFPDHEPRNPVDA